MYARLRTRRKFLRDSVALGAGIIAAGPQVPGLLAAHVPGSKMRFGLVTYLWGQDWDLPTLIANCEKTSVLGVELRVQHAHGVESSLSATERREVKARFADSPVELVGMGTNFDFHHADRSRLQEQIEGAKAYVKLSYDCGGSGVKVKPNALPKGVPYDKTIRQIGESLNEVGRFAAGYGQKIRVEVHGQETSRLPVMKAIMDVANHPSVGVCWNSNPQDLEGRGLEYNFNLVRSRLADTVHIRELNVGDYPYQELMNLFVAADYEGWILLEARTKPEDRVKALAEQREIFAQMLESAQRDQKSLTRGVKVTEHDQKVTVELGGKLFTEYRFADAQRPYFYPVIGPTGAPVIRHWPMGDGPGEAHDHPHHKSLWYTHGDVNGVDFWSDGRTHGKVVHDKFIQVKSGPDVGVIQSKNKWVKADGTVVCTDTRTHRFFSRPDGQFMDFEITLHASHGQVTLGDTKEGSMAIRLAPTMRVEGDVAQGHIVNSEGDRDKPAWGKRAAWCDYYGPVDGDVVGVAIFDHPENPRHPTWWHVRLYGLFAANPFGVHDFEKKPAGTGDLVIPAGESVTFKYRLYFHRGDEKQGKVAERYREYAS